MLLACLLALAQIDGLAAAQAAHRAGDYERATAELAKLPSSAEVEYLWTNLYYESGLPTQALEHAQAGLAHEPGHLGLLFRRTSLYLWLSQPEAARESAAALSGAIASASLSADERPGWEAAAKDFVQRAADLESTAGERNGALMRARVVSLGVIGLALGVLFRTGRRPVRTSA